MKKVIIVQGFDGHVIGSDVPKLATLKIIMGGEFGIEYLDLSGESESEAHKLFFEKLKNSCPQKNKDVVVLLNGTNLTKIAREILCPYIDVLLLKKVLKKGYYGNLPSQILPSDEKVEILLDGALSDFIMDVWKPKD